MAKKIITITNVHCDICPGEVDATHEDVAVGYGKKSVLLDLCDKDFRLLDDMLSLAVDKGRKVSVPTQQTLPGTSARRSASSGGTRAEAKAIKEWAAKNNIDVPPMGRIPEQIKQQYREAVGA